MRGLTSATNRSTAIFAIRKPAAMMSTVPTPGGRPRRWKTQMIPGLKSQISRTLALVRNVRAAEFDGAEERDCSIEIPNDMVIEMYGLRFLRAWALPHFYAHVVTAYDIVRHCGRRHRQERLPQSGWQLHPRERSLSAGRCVLCALNCRERRAPAFAADRQFRLANRRHDAFSLALVRHCDGRVRT